MSIVERTALAKMKGEMDYCLAMANMLQKVIEFNSFILQQMEKNHRSLIEIGGTVSEEMIRKKYDVISQLREDCIELENVIALAHQYEDFLAS